MRLSKIIIHGFKSFNNRTILEFPRDIIAIVGPNGCGKSNVVDAIKWALGEQSAKSLRGGEMSDVIFAGTSKRSPMGMAEVSLVFSKSSDEPPPVPYLDYPNIKVTRILHRDGTSEYRLQDFVCRLKDISDVFLGTGLGSKGYSIIEQGKISSIIASKPQQRRIFFEESARITRFKARRSEAIRKLESSRANLDRIDDILGVLSRQVSSLKRQKKKAVEFEKVKAELSKIDRWRLYSEHKELKSKLGKVTGRMNLSKEKIAKYQAKEDIISNQIAGVELKKTDVESRYQDGVEKYIQLEKKLSNQESSIKVIEEQIKNKKKNIQTLLHEKKIKEQKRNLKSKLAGQSREKITHYQAVFNIKNEELETGLIQFRTVKNDRTQILEDLENKREQLIKLEREIARIKSENNAQIQRKEKLDEEYEILKQDLESKTVAVKEYQASLADLKTEKSRLSSGFSEVESEKQQLATQLEQLDVQRRKLEQQQLDLNKKLSSIKGDISYREKIIRQNQDLSEGSKKLLRLLKEKGIFKQTSGLLVDQIKVEPRWNKGVEALFEGKLGYLVTTDSELARKIVELAGDDSFAPSGILLSLQNNLAEVEFDYQDLNLISARQIVSEINPLIESFLSNCYLAENLNDAFAAMPSLPSGARIATGEGIVLNSDGLVEITGGKEVNPLKLRQELEKFKETNKELQLLNEKLAQKIKNKQELTGEIINQKRQIDSTLQRLQEELRTNESEINLLESKESVSLRNIKEDANRLKRIEQLRKDLGQELKKGIDQDKKTVIADLKTEISKLAEARKSVEEDFNRLSETIQSLQEKTSNWKVKLNSETSNLESTEELIADLEEQMEAHGETIENNKIEIENLHKEQTELESKTGKLVDLVLEQKEKQSQIKEKLEEFKEKLRQHKLEKDKLDFEIDKYKEQLNNLQTEKSRLSGNLSYVEREFSDKFGVDIKEEPDLIDEYGEYGEEQAKLRASKEKRIDTLKYQYNPTAIKEYEEVSQRFIGLEAQRSDLLKAINDLENSIEIITKSTQKRFLDAFNSIAKKFSLLFPKLFNGGTGKLQLTSDDPLEAGVEIVVQPPGKKLQTMELLSGGEKAMTAIALIFSLFLFSPSPFCILDEVDAPLDENNVEKYNELLKEMSERTQFIIVTHNRRTMEAAEMLYGITMEEAGCSRKVSLDLEEAQDLLE
ncbi:MAG: chromosome segregation protein SMC [Deltaproteobacteria bacterium]|jgi:chromosome segregation protein|nr:chromosome segregation protein SMC [Deltaproteobacteria bacterium]